MLALAAKAGFFGALTLTDLRFVCLWLLAALFQQGLLVVKSLNLVFVVLGA